ncbi:hypothetical protein [Alkalicoccobacillus plakortidis]|uniref:Uncharacterized protein n=1 Tax=Alkalicoccobacillus plakortidis TaxID=444060 RepID=A0ABT0XL27_9BACI|nr:hypothetical protein [Alkalicoccobacillus plakortidis]MCM2676614.1 hypothetical protein [Alkalicoccobacillus plakortidis]
MSLGRLFLISVGLALLSVFITPPHRFVMEHGMTISYGFPVKFMEYYSSNGEEPARWELFTFIQTSLQIGELLICAAYYFFVFLIIKLFRDKFKKDREEELGHEQ